VATAKNGGYGVVGFARSGSFFEKWDDFKLHCKQVIKEDEVENQKYAREKRKRRFLQKRRWTQHT